LLSESGAVASFTCRFFDLSDPDAEKLPFRDKPPKWIAFLRRKNADDAILGFLDFSGTRADVAKIL